MNNMREKPIIINDDTVPAPDYVKSTKVVGQLLGAFRELRWAAYKIDEKRLWDQAAQLESYLRGNGLAEEANKIIEDLAIEHTRTETGDMQIKEPTNVLYRGRLDYISGILLRIAGIDEAIANHGHEIHVLQKLHDEVIRRFERFAIQTDVEVALQAIEKSLVKYSTEVKEWIENPNNHGISAVSVAPKSGGAFSGGFNSPERSKCNRCGSMQHSYCGPAKV